MGGGILFYSDDGLSWTKYEALLTNADDTNIAGRVVLAVSPTGRNYVYAMGMTVEEDLCHFNYKMSYYYLF